MMSIIMKCLMLTMLMSLTLTNNVVDAQSPPGQTGFCSDSSPRIRKEFRDLTDTEWTNYMNAAHGLLDSGIWTNYVALHDEQFQDIHGTPFFLPWHRRFIYEYETALRAFNPSVTIPYWDSSLDAGSPIDSAIVQSLSHGWGSLSDSTSSCSWSVSYPSGHCLSRQLSPDSRLAPPAFFNVLASGQAVIDFSSLSPEMTSALQSGCRLVDGSRFGIFGCLLELVHSYVHVFVGGDMSQSVSANDPLFFHHHAFIDKIWWNRQATQPNEFSGIFQGNEVSVNTPMPSYGTPVSSVLATTQCVIYQPYQGGVVSGPRLQRRQAEFQKLRNTATTKKTCNKSTENAKHTPLYENHLLNRPGHLPVPLSDHFIKNMGYNETVIRALEHVLYTFIDKHNQRTRSANVTSSI